MSIQEIYGRISLMLPGAWSFIERNRNRSLLELSRDFRSQGRAPSPELLEAVELMARPDLGRRAAADLRLSLQNGAGANAAAHHGVESYPELVQGSLLFGLEEISRSLDGRPCAPVLVLACENVPLNSATCPGGFLFGRRRDGDRFQKVHLFKRSRDRLIVGRTPSLTIDDLHLFLKRIDQAELRPWEKAGLKKIVEPLMDDDLFLNCPGFLEQAALLNRRLWSQRFKIKDHPPLAFLSLEGLASRCLIGDLARTDSLAARLIFDGQVLGHVLRRLGGLSGCWDCSLLHSGGGRPDGDRSRPLGTVLFWEISPAGRADSMGLTVKNGRPHLTGPSLTLPLSPESLIEALTLKKISPGLFLSFAVLALGHGLRTYGGVYMADYLPRMLSPVLELVPSAGQEADMSWFASLVAGLTPIQIGSGRDGLFPAGAVELAALGPLGADFFERLGTLKISEVWPFSASEWYLEETRPERRIGGWADDLERLKRTGDGIRLSPA